MDKSNASHGMKKDEEQLETSPEDLELEDLEERAEDKAKSLRAKLKSCDEEKRKILEDLQRTKADFLNSRRRIEEQATRNTERAIDDFIVALLPIVDSFDMAMADKKVWESADESWRKGIEAIQAQVHSLLKAYNVEQIGTEGEHFDPERHEAVSNTPVDEEDAVDTVIQIFQKGYGRNGHIIRTAKVTVGHM